MELECVRGRVRGRVRESLDGGTVGWWDGGGEGLEQVHLGLFRFTNFAFNCSFEIVEAYSTSSNFI